MPPVICAMVMPLPALSLTVKVTVGALPATPLSTFRMSTIDARARCADSVGTVCAPLMEASNSSSPCGMWHWVHWLSVTCGRLTWFCAGGEVHVVVAGAASRAAGILEPGIGLRRAGLRWLVAEFAAPRIGRQTHRGPVGNALVECR